MARPQAPAVGVWRWSATGGWSEAPDEVAAEEPLQLLLNGEPLSVVMRTPGHDLELALGLLLAEGVIGGRADVGFARVSAESGEAAAEGFDLRPDLVESNQVDVHLAGPPRRRPERSFLSSSACGVCGATTV